ncbi:DNA primase [Companilactobacillus sp. RD055328]|uniref:bifunctional DNA primase/polymerase n=1 Tax=Companilactobacillus sp. RD055328 TaxID=2916634 RepID=UPI001FC8588A|nr:bifunctional DNA primase/polymerase [Companilactobacillus sp. RD055328]GKQ42941.1 DNA primase [Companilactobacillus sp. RD055328]
MKNLVNYAVKYAERGMSVLPMLNKQPMIKFADKPPLTVAEIEEFWKLHPYAQIALRTTNFFVIDIDTKDAHGSDGFKSIESISDDLLIDTLAQKTASGGKQLFYLKRNDIDVRQNIGWLDGVDVKAHINNYVMVAPSEFKNNQYEWLNKKPIATAPKELIKLINKREYNSDYDPTKVKFSSEKTATSELFEQIVNGLGETGGRNNALASFIGGLLFRNVDVDITYQLAKQTNENTEKSLSIKEFDKTFDSMVKKEIRRREVADGINGAIETNAEN